MSLREKLTDLSGALASITRGPDAYPSSMSYEGNKADCRVPDDWLLKNKRPLLHGREVLQAVLATWQSRAKELPC